MVAEYQDNLIRSELLLQQLLAQYPTSNKCSDAAYQLGDIYENRKPSQYRRAAIYFERCVEWNSNTQFDARMRAARIYDRHLSERSKATELYKAVLASRDRRAPPAGSPAAIGRNPIAFLCRPKPCNLALMTTPDLRRPILYSMAAAVVTLLLKFTAYFYTDSVGLLSDAAETTVNLVAALTAWLSLRYAAKPVDVEHTYGHKKIEFFSSGLEAVLILAAAVGIGGYCGPPSVRPGTAE